MILNDNIVREVMSLNSQGLSPSRIFDAIYNGRRGRKPVPASFFAHYGFLMSAGTASAAPKAPRKAKAPKGGLANGTTVAYHKADDTESVWSVLNTDGTTIVACKVSDLDENGEPNDGVELNRFPSMLKDLASGKCRKGQTKPLFSVV